MGAGYLDFRVFGLARNPSDTFVLGFRVLRFGGLQGAGRTRICLHGLGSFFRD